MNWKASTVWVLLTFGSLAIVTGCNKPGEGSKKPNTPGPAPANTTDSK